MKPKAALAYGAAFGAALALHLGMAAVLGGVLRPGEDRITEGELSAQQEPLAVTFRRPEPVRLEPQPAPAMTRLRAPAPEPPPEPPPVEPEAWDPRVPMPVEESVDGLEPANPAQRDTLLTQETTDSPTAQALPARSRGEAAPSVGRVKPRPLAPIDAEAVYPLGSRLRGEEGVVRLSVSIDAKGRIELLQVLESSGFAALDRAAERAVRQTPFAPATWDNRPVAGELAIVVRFRLD